MRRKQFRSTQRKSKYTFPHVVVCNKRLHFFFLLGNFLVFTLWWDTVKASALEITLVLCLFFNSIQIFLLSLNVSLFYPHMCTGEGIADIYTVYILQTIIQEVKCLLTFHSFPHNFPQILCLILPHCNFLYIYFYCYYGLSKREKSIIHFLI